MKVLDPPDLLKELFNIHPFSAGRILRIESGQKYTGLMTTEGNIGVCANLTAFVKPDPAVMIDPDFTNIEHRILVNAWLNANVNYQAEQLGSGDIYHLNRFQDSTRNVMIGDFTPLVQKFFDDRIPIKVFDLQEQGTYLTPMVQLEESLKEAEVVILTSTCWSNMSFRQIFGLIAPNARVYMLGPSTTLHKLFLNKYRISGLYGMLFDVSDHLVLDLIAEGHGTRQFGKRGKKVSLLP